VGPDECVTGREGQFGEESAYALKSCTGATKLVSHTSPPLSDIVEAILEPSQNWMTEQLVRTLGQQMGEEGSWREGFRIEEEFLTLQVGVDSLDLALRDGSGLAAYNLVTPRALVRILSFMRRSPHSELYRLALAEPGEEEGTLRRRLPGFEGRVFAKTGTITHVNSLSGYLVTGEGREVIFSILTNGSGLPSGGVRAAIDRIVEEASRR
jgi:D-alanyl-D-alanine carboxypeptidase/D-alanyl-D-alanine-endopeptidase (penicillin-binding protein 4)